MTLDPKPIQPVLLFLKYKGIPAPWEITDQHKRFGFKCKKYAKWQEVHVSEHSREALKSVGDSLIDNSEFDLANFGEISQIWERVQRWTKDKDNLAFEPEILPSFDKLSRIIEVGACKAEVVDLVIQESYLGCDKIEPHDRWLLFLSINVFELLKSSKRYKNFVNRSEGELGSNIDDPKKFVAQVAYTIVELYESVGFDVISDPSSVITLFVKELGLTEKPSYTEANASKKVMALPKVWIQNYDGPAIELVKLKHSEGDVFVKLNRSHPVFESDSTLSQLLSNEQYWQIVGTSILSHTGQLDDLQDFFDTFSRHLRAVLR